MPGVGKGDLFFNGPGPNTHNSKRHWQLTDNNKDLSALSVV